MDMKGKFERALASPENVYGHPGDVLGDTGLNNAQKREILLRWEAEAIHMQESDAEGFTGGERSHLDEIMTALRNL